MRGDLFVFSKLHGETDFLRGTFQKKSDVSETKQLHLPSLFFFIRNIKVLKEMFLGEALRIPECHMDALCGENIVKTRFRTIATF